jgi:hypothetical protein
MGIRKETSNRYGLRDALAAIVASGGDIRSTSTLGEALAAGDEAVGVAVLSDLYQRMGLEPLRVDLSDLWRELGVKLDGRSTIVFDETASGAAIRRAITDE